MPETKDIRYLVRIANTDLEGKKRVGYGLTKIKGVSYMLANALCRLSKVDPTKKAGELNEAEIGRLDEILKNPIKMGLPNFLVNRKKDPETGIDMHLIGAELAFTHDNDLKMMKKIKSYKGIRHIQGLPVRGQRTKSNFRKNKGKGSLGVKRNPTAKSGRT